MWLCALRPQVVKLDWASSPAGAYCGYIWTMDLEGSALRGAPVCATSHLPGLCYPPARHLNLAAFRNRPISFSLDTWTCSWVPFAKTPSGALHIIWCHRDLNDRFWQVRQGYSRQVVHHVSHKVGGEPDLG